MGFSLDALEIGHLYTRPQLAKLWGYESFHAIARGVLTPKGAGAIVLFVTREKQESLTQYQDFLSGDRLHWEGEKGHRTDNRIANAYSSGDEIHLFYRDVHHTPFRYHGQVYLTQFDRYRDRPSQFVFALVHDLSPLDDITSHTSEFSNVTETERESIVKARIGQGEFREALLALWGGCSVTRITRADLVRASHIKPWRYCTNAERLNRFNGLLLLPQYDHLFDRGYITFDDRGKLEPSPAIRALSPERLGIDLSSRIAGIQSEHLPFLEYHHHEVFLARRN